MSIHGIETVAEAAATVEEVDKPKDQSPIEK
jgi:hypothetical protein